MLKIKIIKLVINSEKDKVKFALIKKYVLGFTNENM